MNCRCGGIILDDDGMLVCEKCGLFSYDLVNTYDEDMTLFNNTNNYIKYSRVSHLKQTIFEITGCQTKKIPNQYLELIQKQFIPKSTVEENIQAMRTFLNKKHMNHFLKMTNHILTTMKIINPPKVDDGLMQQLTHKFIPIAERFEGINTGRTNLLPNAFLLKKFFEELGRYEFLPFI